MAGDEGPALPFWRRWVGRVGWPALRRAGLGLVVVLAASGGGFAFIAGAAPDRVDLDLGAPSVFYALPEVVTDLDSGSGRPHYVRLALVLEVPKTDTDVLQAGEPAILDAVQQHLRTLRAADLAGGAGTQLLRQTVRDIVERRVRPSELRGVLLTQFLVN